MKKCSTSPVIRERQIKTVMRCRLTPVRKATIKKTGHYGCWRTCEERDSCACTLLAGVWTGAATTERVWRLLKKWKIRRPHDPAIPLLGTYPKTLTQLFVQTTSTAALSQQLRRGDHLYVHQRVRGQGRFGLFAQRSSTQPRKARNTAVRDNMGGSWEYSTECKKSDKKGQKLYNFTRVKDKTSNK